MILILKLKKKIFYFCTFFLKLHCKYSNSYYIKRQWHVFMKNEKNYLTNSEPPVHTFKLNICDRFGLVLFLF